MIFVLLAGVAISAFCAGFLIGRAERLARHRHNWAKWRRETLYASGGSSTTCNVRECYGCGLTQAHPV